MSRSLGTNIIKSIKECLEICCDNSIELCIYLKWTDREHIFQEMKRIEEEECLKGLYKW